MISLVEIEAAARRLAPVINATPLGTSRALSELVGASVLVKPEHLQRTGSFKIRGAFNFLSLLTESGARPDVVAASAGNHAEGVALAANLCGLNATVFMPINASIPKVEATRAYGAQVILRGGSVDECIRLARAHGAATGAIFVPPFDDPAIVAGQATIGLEMASDADLSGTVLVPVGGGGLLAGIAAALKLAGSKVQVVGVEAGGVASMAAALSAGHPVALDASATMADGIAVREVSDLTLSYAKAYVDAMVSVTEDETSQALLVLLERSKWLVEPAGAVGLAAVLAGKVPGPPPYVIVLSGGNIDPLLLTRLIEHGLSAAGRYAMVRVVLSDRPGELARLTDTVAQHGLNVLSVEHHRSGVRVGIDEVEVLLTLETRGRAQRDDVVSNLHAAGFRAEILQ